MSREKQIEEMAKDLGIAFQLAGTTRFGAVAEVLVNAGYRKQEWISVEERLPEKSKQYLCRCIIKDNFSHPFYMVLRYILIGENPHFKHEHENGLKITHWMPLPEAPKMKGGAE